MAQLSMNMKYFISPPFVIFGFVFGVLLAGCVSARNTRLYVVEYQIKPSRAATEKANREVVLRLLYPLVSELELQEKKVFEIGGTFFFFSREGSELFYLEAWQGHNQIVIQVTDLTKSVRPSPQLNRSRQYLAETLTRHFCSQVKIINYGTPPLHAIGSNP